MRKLKLFFSMLMLIAFSVGNVWATDITYTFSSKSWAATSGGSAASWTSGQDGAGFSNNGIQVTTTASGANGTSPVSFTNVTKVVCTYNTNASKGKGTIDVQVGTNDAKSVNWAYSGSASGTSANFTAAVNYSTPETGNVKITLNTTTNSIYLVSVTITTQSSDPEVSVSPDSWDFGTVHASDDASKVFSVSGSNLIAGDLTLTVPTGFSVSPSSIAVDGTLAATNVTVSKNTTTEDDYAGNLSISGGGLESAKTVALTMTVDADPAPTGTFEPFSGDIEEGDYLIVVDGAGMNTTVSSSRLQYTALTLTGENYVNPDASVIWHVEASDVYWTIYNAEEKKYAAATGSNNQAQMLASGTDNKSLWTITHSGSVYTIQNKSNSRYLKKNGTYGFACYADGTVSLYKKVDGTVKPSAELAYADAQKLAKVGASFTAPTLDNPYSVTVTYASDNTEVATVDPSTGTVSIVAAGKAVITASFAGNDDYKAGSASYTLFVASEAGTSAEPLSEASAKALIDLGCTMTVHVNGLVLSQNSTNFTVTLTNGFQFYKAKDLNNVAFESAYLAAGDEVTAVGALKKFSSTYELDEGCYLTYYQQAATSLTPIANTKETAYSVARALGYAAEPLVYQLTDPIYIEGVVYKVENFNSTNGTLDIYIKDADADNEFELFRCKGIYDESLTAFTAADDVREGDQVIGYGVLKHFTNSTTDIWEFDNNATGDYLVSLVRPTIPVTGINLTESTASVAVGAKVTLHASVEPSTANNKTIVWSVQSGSDKASVADGVVTGIAEGTAVIRAASDEDASIYKECTVTVSPLSAWATTYTSNITLSTEGGTSASAAKVKFDGEETEYAAIKAGTGSAAGAVVVNVPAQATKLHFHAYSWYSETVELTVSAPAGVTVTPSTAIAINKNSGIKENSPFTLAEGSTPQYDAYFVVSLSDNSEPVALTISATSGKRFVLFGVNQEGGIVLESIAVSGTASVLEYTDGQHFDPTGLTVTGTYTDASTAPITEDIVWAFDPDPLTEGTTSVSVTATAAGFTSDAFVVNGLTVGSAAPLSPWATTWTSNLDDVTGAKVKFYGEETEYAAIKAGSGSAAGTATLNIPAQATELHLHAYGWNTEDVTLSITAPAGVTVTPASITLNRNAGFASNSPFTLAEGSTPQTDAYYALSLSGNTDAIELTITATSGKRFLLFGVNQVGGVVPVLKSISITGEATELEYEDGDEFDPAGLGVNAIYTLNDVDQEPVAVAAKDIEWSFDPANLTTGTTSVTVTATVGDKSANLVVNGLNVVSATPEITTQPANYVNFTVTKDDALPAAKTITVSLKSVASATAVLGGTNPEAFNISKTALVDGDEINVSVVSTATVGAYVATVTISDNAGVAADKVVTINLTVKAPEVEETPVSTSSKWVAATEIADGMQVLITGFKSSKRYAIGAQTDNNRTAVEGSMDGDVFTPGENTMAFTVVAQEGGKYALRASNGKYLYAASSSKNYLRSQDEVDDNAKWTLSVSSATANGTNSNNQLKLNTSSNIFSCYASGQTAIALYVPQVVEKDLIRGDLSNGKWGTLCPKQDVENVEGAEFFQIAYLEEKDGKPFNMHFDAISGTTLEAGKPYFFIANATEIRGIKTGAVLEAAGEGENGFHGYIGTGSWELPYVAEYNSAGDNTFVIHGNKVVRINQSGTMLPSERCYILINATVPSRGAVAPAPGRRRISMGVQSEQTATGVDNVQGDNVQSTKVLINGQLFIIRGEKMYDATGRLVK